MSRERQNTQLELAFLGCTGGEASVCDGEGSELPSVETNSETPVEQQKLTNLMEEVLERKNLKEAYQRISSTKGAKTAGVDGMTVAQLAKYNAKHWEKIEAELRAGTYSPYPIKRVEIPKPGGGVRKLGIPTALDRLIQQAILLVLQPRFDPTFSEHSYGFRPGRNAHQAIAQAQEYQEEGYDWVADIDLEKFFDRVNHDRLMSTLAKRIDDKPLLKLIRAFLNSGVMEEGLVNPTVEGTPQGSPLSPLLSNIVLDELDRELTKRGHRFVRYADDCNIYVRSERAGQRVMQSITHFVERKLRLKVNQKKSKVDKPGNRKFLGFSFGKFGIPRRRIHDESITRFKEKIRKLTCRKQGGSLEIILKRLGYYLRGWLNYYGYCQTQNVLTRLEGWIRRRLRCLLWKRWKTSRKRYANLRKLGVSHSVARSALGNSCSLWRKSNHPAVQQALSNKFWISEGLPALMVKQ